MPIVELHTYTPMCDRCGARGETWREIPDTDLDKVLPPGWKLQRVRVRVRVNGGTPADTRFALVLCGECIATADPRENDSQA